MRAFLTGLCGLVLRIFFRRIEIVGAEHVPEAGPVIFVINHPNGLLDPLFVICHSGRRVSLLAKEPLWRVPVIGAFVRALECLPVYRKQDGADPTQNQRMLERVEQLLERGNAIALFPEGTSHSDRSLRPLRYGAARMALSAAASRKAWGNALVRVVPMGLYYSRKTRFRSRALVTFGAPLTPPELPLAPGEEPPKAEVAALTEALTEALGRLTLEAPTEEAAELAERAERVLRAAERDADFLALPGAAPAPRTLSEQRQIRQRLVDGYVRLVPDAGASEGALGAKGYELVKKLEARLVAYETKVGNHGLRPEQRVLFTTREVTRASLGALVTVLGLLPLALFGAVVNFGTYHAVRWVAMRIAKGEEDVVATGKATAGLLLFPLTWLLVSGLLGAVTERPLPAALFLALCPLAAYAALVVRERATHASTQSFVIWTLWVRPGLRRWVVEERRAIADEIYALGALLESALERQSV